MGKSVMVIIAGLLLAGGCAKQQAVTPRASELRGAAGALCFDPPVAQEEPPLQLARSDRSPVAYVGYEESVAREFYIRLDDRVLFRDRYTSYDRQAIDRRSGIRYR